MKAARMAMVGAKFWCCKNGIKPPRIEFEHVGISFFTLFLLSVLGIALAIWQLRSRRIFDLALHSLTCTHMCSDSCYIRTIIHVSNNMGVAAVLAGTSD